MLWPWGDTFDPARLNSAEGGRGDTAAVGTFPVSLNSVFDITRCFIDGMAEPAGAATAIEIMTEADASLFI